jgi:glucose-1-phosphate cytidylyltransferase|tara:strand:- start:9627 stop:10400 length:774 start_codon:yes stop_codon:yes gene_type:complete
MKAVILAGGLGSRIAEETENKPKPMIEIGGRPILWHIMKIYSSYGINDFIICCGYKGYVIKEYFKNYFIHMSDVTFSMSDNSMKVHHNNAESWNVTLINTGEHTMTGGRLKRIHSYVKEEEAFCMTYGDGIGNINISDLISFHNQHGKKATLTATRPSARYGALKLGANNLVTHFEEKPKGEGSWINGGFFILHPSVINTIKEDNTIWENEPLNKLASENQLFAFKHDGFWMPMDTLREKNLLNKLWDSGEAPWKTW